jgi:hypothetical protein
MKNLFGEGENEVHFESKYHARNSAKRVDRRKDADLNELPTPSATDVRGSPGNPTRTRPKNFKDKSAEVNLRTRCVIDT